MKNKKRQVSLREFGRMLGVTGEAIRRAVRDKRIDPLFIGARATKTGRSVPVIIDPEAAAECWVASTRRTRPAAIRADAPERVIKLAVYRVAQQVRAEQARVQAQQLK